LLLPLLFKFLVGLGLNGFLGLVDGNAATSATTFILKKNNF